MQIFISSGLYCRGNPSRAILLITNPSKGFDTYSCHLIQTSATHCALYDKGRGVMIFALANVAKIVIAENKTGAAGART